MSFQVIETTEKRAKDGSLICRYEVFDFGCCGRGQPHLKVKGVLREHPDHFDVHVFEGRTRSYIFEFGSRSEAVDFIEEALSSKGSLIQAVLNKEDKEPRTLGSESLKLEALSCLPVHASKISFKRKDEWRNQEIWGIFDKNTGTFLGQIQKSTYYNDLYHLLLAFKAYSGSELLNNYAQTVASFNSKKEAEDYAKKVLADGFFDVEDLLYMSRWKECMRELDYYEWM